VSFLDEDETSKVELAVLAAVVGERAGRALLAAYCSIREIALAPDAELLAAGVTPSRIRAFRAALDLGARALAAPLVGQEMPGPHAIAAYFSPKLALAPVEEFWAVGLDVRHRVTYEAMLARGSMTGVDVHPRDVFRALIRAGAVAVIFCHNHPSGDAAPSRQDVELTHRLRNVGELVGIAVLDHVVVGGASAWTAWSMGGPWRPVSNAGS
jgi:DNA repair protein RadC